MYRDRLISGFRSNMVDTFLKLVKVSLTNNSHFTILEHVEWVISRFEALENAVNTTKTAFYANSTVVKCPKHGWVFSLKKLSGNKCPKCFKNRLLYKKRVSKKDKNKE